jgi:hypothetical protein
MDHPELLRPSTTGGDAADVSTLLKLLKDWRDKWNPKEEEYHSRIWYRGHANCSWRLLPKLYRDADADPALRHIYGDGEERRLNLEREMLEEFRNAAAPFINANDLLTVFFTAQHFGLPTRLLDWTTNPLVAAYFAAAGEPAATGEILVMDASKCVQKPSDFAGEAKKPEKDRLPTEEMIGEFVVGTRHPHAVGAINESFWRPSPAKRVIVPIRPDAALGRIGQQSSRFTLHRHEAESVTNPSLTGIKIPSGAAKATILEELNRLNINHHSIFHDLDHLAKGISEARRWGKP